MIHSFPRSHGNHFEELLHRARHQRPAAIEICRPPPAGDVKEPAVNPRVSKIERRALTALMLTLALGGCASPQRPPMQEPPAVLVVGTERSAPKLANGGQALPLRKAVEQLAPPDYVVRWVGVDASRQSAPVTWHAGQTWTEALEEATQAVPGVIVTIATGSRLVLMRGVSNEMRPLPKPTPQSTVKPTTKSTIESDPDADRGAPAVLAKRLVREPRAGNGAAANAAEAVRTPPLVSASAARSIRPAQAALDRVTVQGVKTSVPTAWAIEPEDHTVRLALDRWSRKAGWRLLWELGVDYPITVPADIDGSFEEAIAVVVRSLSQADVPPKAVFYRGNQVLRLIPRGKE
jgi:hypothetical protein